MKNRMNLVGTALGLALVGASAHADMKDPIPDSLSLGGVTLYGTIDVGYTYESHGVPLSSQYLGGLEYQSFTTTRNFGGSISTLSESALEQSKIGIRVSEPIFNGFTLVGRAETGFNPLSGQLTDACGAIATNGGKAQGTQTANADSSRCGQAFNSVLYGGASSPMYGTLTIGRHNSLQLDALAVYDPQALSYAFSFLGFSGFDGGAGSTEAARWDNSVRYAYVYGPATANGHVNLMYTNGGLDTGILGKGYAAEIGFTYQGLSVDAVYENAKGAVNLRSSFDDVANPLINPISAANGVAVATPGLAAYISNDTSFNIMAKYVFELPGKDKLTVYAGYSHIEKAHGDYEVGAASQGNYPLDVGININNTAYYNLEWLGARYAMASGLNLSAGLYKADQNSWTIGLGTTGTDNIGCSGAGLLCDGDFYEVSVVADYVYNKHYDLYAGVNWSEVTDGLASGFNPNQFATASTNGLTGSQNQSTVTFGARVKF